MDVGRFSFDIRHVLKEANLLRNKNGRSYKYDLVILFARIWLLKAEIFVKPSSTPLLLTTSVEDFIGGLHEESRFLQKSLYPQWKQKTEHQILKLVKQVPGQVESLYKSSQSVDSAGNAARDLLYKFLVQVMLFKAEMLLLLLLKNEMGSMYPLKNQIGTLREGLIFLLNSDINQPKEDTEDEKLILADIEGLAAGVISLCNSCPADRVTDDEDIKNMEFQLSDLLMKVQLLKAKLKELYFQLPRLSLPKTPGLGSVISLSQKLGELASHEHDSVACATYQIEAVHKDLDFIIFEYGHVSEKKECIDIRARLVNAAYQVECVIDSMVVGSDSVSQQLLWLYHLSEEITQVKQQVIDYCENTPDDVGFQTDSYGYQPLVSPLATPSMQEVVVGFADEKEVIIDRLTGGNMGLEVVSITGMPGIGKTTLAKDVYWSPIIAYHFHTRVWCYVSQTYRKRALLFDILSQITDVTDKIHALSDENLEFQLYRHLKGRRYLIVIDDIWSTETWDELQELFPNDANGSRVLMTSRLYYVVPNPHPLRLLSDEESWELLERKVFGKKLCPPEMLKVGMQIARNCKGLPLAIVTVAGLLVRAHNLEKWREIAESVSSQIVNDKVTEYMGIFELSYQHLPDHLKECFFYFAVCPRDEDISVRKLLWLWIAEGFIPKVEFKRLEDLAEDYLMDLIQRSLVLASKRTSDGKVKTCQVHDQILDFCLLKAKDANFFQLISGEPSYGSSDGLHYEDCNRSNFINSEHRLSICGDPEEFIASRPCGPFVRSLWVFATDEMYPGCHSDVSFICNFKLLKVLDLESVNVGNTLENGIDLPAHLRYLGVGGDMDSIPSSLPKLQNLETLVVKGLTNKFVLPDTIWSMTKLRHVLVTNHCIFTLQNDKNGSDSKLYSLVSLSMPSFSFGEETKNIIMRLPNLRKLKCVLLQPQGGPRNGCRFPELGSLYHLESLKISYFGRALNTVEWNLPLSLKKLTLSNFRLPWNQISAIGMLPNIEVLKLVSRAFEGQRWEMTEGGFSKLRYLILDSLNMVHWCADDDSLPCLEQLVLRNCKQLEEVPSSFGYSWSLQKIEVHQCGIYAEDLFRSIVEEQWDCGNTDLIVNFS